MNSSIVKRFLDEDLTMTEKLNALETVALLDEHTCIELLDCFPPHTRLGGYLREVLVTEGAVVDALCVLLWEGRGALRAAAALRLAELGDPDALPELIALLGRQLLNHHNNIFHDPLLLSTLIDAIYACWIPGQAAAPRAIVEALTAHTPAVRRAASAALRKMGPDACVAASRLVDLLNHPNEDIRLEAAELLPTITPPAIYEPYMTQLLKDEPDLLVRWVAQYELQRQPQIPAA